jgi:hypothetical protein
MGIIIELIMGLLNIGIIIGLYGNNYRVKYRTI